MSIAPSLADGLKIQTPDFQTFELQQTRTPDSIACRNLNVSCRYGRLYNGDGAVNTGKRLYKPLTGAGFVLEVTSGGLHNFQHLSDVLLALDERSIVYVWSAWRDSRITCEEISNRDL